MPNINKVVFGSATLIDLTTSTLSSADQIVSGVTAYDRGGNLLTGTASISTAAISVVDTTDSHGGTIREITALDISDTTATASDVASGKYFYTANGTKTQGTASGGGASNCVTGTFTTGSTGGVDETITIPYTGNGYPVFIVISVPEGANNASGTVYSTVHQYGVISVIVVKDTNVVPTYAGQTGFLTSNTARVIRQYKSSSSTAASFSMGYGGGFIFDSANAAISHDTFFIRINSKTQISYFVSSNSYGLLPDTEYTYSITYSS